MVMCDLLMHTSSVNFRRHLHAENRRKISIFTFRGGGGDFSVQGVQVKWLKMCFFCYFEEVLIVSTVV